MCDKYSKEWWCLWIKAASIRAVKTFAQAMLGTIMGSVFLSDVNWMLCLSASVVAAIVSLLTSIVGLPEIEVMGNE